MSRSLYVLTALVVIAFTWAYFMPIDISVRARGIVRPQGDPIRIVTEVGGRIHKVRIQEGADVRTGDVILEFDNRELLLKKRSLESRIHFTELRLADIPRQLDDVTAIEEQSASVDSLERDAISRTTQAVLENARLRFTRTEQLLGEGLIAHQVHDDARTALRQAEAEYSRISAKSADLKRAQSDARLRDITAQATPLRAELAALYQQLEQTQLELTRLTITSPVDGQITSLASLHPDETISAGATIAALVPRSHSLIIESWLPTSERSFVHAGQQVRLQKDNFETFDGTLLSISPDARFNESLTGAYRVLIESGDPALRLGMTFQVHFITRHERLLWLLFQNIRKHL